MKKTALILLCALLLAGCVRREAPVPASPVPTVTPSPTAAPAALSPAPPASESAGSALPTATPAPEPPAPAPAGPVTAGVYRWDGGESGAWVLNLKENGTFSVIGGERIYNGEGWSDNGDGTVVTGPTEGAGAAPFFDEFGSSLWRVSGERCEPIY